MLTENEVMVLLLFAICFLLTFITFFLMNHDLTAPVVAFNGGMTFSSFFALISVNRWDLIIHSNTILTITTALMIMSTSSYFAYKSYKGKNLEKFSPIEFPTLNVKLLVSIFLMFVLAYFSFTEMYHLSISLGNTSGYTNIINTVRPAIEKEQVYMSRWMSYRILIAQFITCFYLYMFFSNTIFFKFRIKYLLLLLPSMCYFPFIILSTGRIALLVLLIYIFVIAGTLYQKKYNYNLSSSIRILFNALIGCIVFVLFFFLLGELTGKSLSATRSPVVIISHYAGLSIPAFDHYLNYINIDTGYFGETTLVGPYRNLNALGFSLPTPRIFLDFVKMDGIDTNVYTALMRYLNDFGLIGMYGVVSLLSMGYSSLYYFIKYRSNNPIYLIFYAMNVFPLYLFSIDDRFFIDIVNMQFLYGLILLWICYKVYIKPNLINRKEKIV